MIARHQLDESINEEMRILYVALTRASQKLILTGVIKSIDEIKEQLRRNVGVSVTDAQVERFHILQTLDGVRDLSLIEHRFDPSPDEDES